ncbi:MAG: hypothetical protein KAT31_03570 [Bacteroidales bacterium]|nr:hypothetical protein [Bacteroidales bacterium]
MMKITKWIIWLLLVLPVGSYAQSLFEGGDTDEKESPFQLNGYGRGVIYTGAYESPALPEIRSAYGEAALKINAFSGTRGKLFSEIRFRSGYEYNEPIQQFQLREAYADLYLGDFDLRAGQQIIAWGRADGINPTNNLCPQDYFVRSPVADDMRLGNFLFRGRYTIQSRIRLEGIWVPVYRHSIYRFDLFDMPDFVSFTDAYSPDAALKNGSFAGKLAFLFDRFDGSISWFNGYDPMPGIEAGPLPETPGKTPTINMYARPFRQQTVGLDFSFGLGSFGVRGEAAYREPTADYKGRIFVPNRDLRYVLGIDRSFGDFAIMVMYTGQYVFDFEEMQIMGGIPDIGPEQLQQPAIWGMLGPMMDQQLAGFNRIIFDQIKEISHSLAARPAMSLFHNVLDLEVFGLYNFSTEEWALMPKLSWSVSDNLKLGIGGEYFEGPQNTRYDLIAPVFNGVFMELRYSF